MFSDKIKVENTMYQCFLLCKKFKIYLNLYSALLILIKKYWGFPSGTVVKNPSTNAGDTGSSPRPGSSHMPRSN